MNRYFHMSEQMFSAWTTALIDESFDWMQIGTSDEYCNDISVHKYGLRLISWEDRGFEIVDDAKYMMFLLRWA